MRKDIFAGTTADPREKLQGCAEGTKAFIQPSSYFIFLSRRSCFSRITNDWPRRRTDAILCRQLFPVEFADEISAPEASRSMSLSAVDDGRCRTIRQKANRKISWPSISKNRPETRKLRRCIRWVLTEEKHARAWISVVDLVSLYIFRANKFLLVISHFFQCSNI